MESEYAEVLEESSDITIQRKKMLKELSELWWYFSQWSHREQYNQVFLEIYSREDLFFVIHQQETKFWDILIPYDVSTHAYSQVRWIKIGVLLLFIFTILSFIISKLLFTKLALKDIFYISKKLKDIDLNHVEKIDLHLNKNDEINTIVDSINNFLDIIEQNTKSLKDFNSQVAHEFKTPLMVISSELEYLILSWKNNESFGKIERQIDVLNELLETFLFISKIENFKWDIKKNTIDISSIIKEKTDILKKIYHSKGIKIVEKIPGSILLTTNKKLVEILIKNILDNAFKYNKQWWKISIIFDKNTLTIKDSWVGISKKNLSKIFDSFYRANTKWKWYWVWLNIVKKITNILDYKLEVKSEKGSWTEFKIIFK